MPPFEAFLALRYLRPRRTFVSVITVISIIGVSLGVAVLIVVIAVMSGFDQEWRDRILGFNAHLKVYPAGPSSPADDQALMRQIAANSNVVGVSPFIHGQAAVTTEPAEGDPSFSAPLLVGIDPASQGSVSVLPRSIVQGGFDLHDKGLLVGIEYASKMGLSVGDRVAVYSPGSLQKMVRAAGKTNEERILPEEFTVRGIFDVGFPVYNGSVIVTSLQDAGELYQESEGGQHGIEVKLRDSFQAGKSPARTQVQNAVPQITSTSPAWMDAGKS